MQQVLLVLLAVVLLGLLLVSLRNRVVLKLGVRNIPRRRAQTALIVGGLTLSTIIITSALGTGDTMTYSNRSQAVEALGSIDEQISGRPDVNGVSKIDIAQYERLRARLAAEPLVDGIAPAIYQGVALVSREQGQGEPGALLFAADATFDAQFGAPETLGGTPAPLAQLQPGEAYLGQLAAERLGLGDGSTVVVHVGPRPLELKVRAVIKDTGWGNSRGGRVSPAIVLPLAEVQRMAGLAGQITTILISNQGDRFGGAAHSDDVTRILRVSLIDEVVAGELVGLLRTPELRAAIEAGVETISDDEDRRAEQVATLRRELDKPGISDALRSLIADNELNAWLREQPISEQTADRLAQDFARLNELVVADVKAREIASADLQGASFTNMFFIFGSFSVLAGVLMIFLIFVMLAAERKSEMGMARAVGMQRRHLIQMFVTEGTVYDLLAAAVGVLLGVGVAYVMVGAIADSRAETGRTIAIRFHIEPSSLISAGCLGILLTFAVVSISSWRVSRLNIVSAIRDLPDDLEGKRVSWWRRIWSVGRAPLVLLGGGLVMLLGYERGEASLVTAGVSLAIVGVGLLLQWLLGLLHIPARRRDRIAFSLIGLALLGFWLPGLELWEEPLGLQPLKAGIEVFVISGIAEVAGAIWLFMYNADTFMAFFNGLASRFGNLTPVLKTATAYPLSARFRTGMALSMFALVTFTIITMTVIIQAVDQVFTRPNALSGGFDVEASMNGSNRFADLSAQLAGHPEVPAAEIAVVGRRTSLSVEARQLGAPSQTWTGTGFQGLDDALINQVRQHYHFLHRAPGYASDDAIWQALLTRDDVVVLHSFSVPQRKNFRPGTRSGVLVQGFDLSDDQMPPLELEVRDPRAGTLRRFQVIGVLNESWFGRIVGHERLIETLAGREVLPSHFYIKARPGADIPTLARQLESAFLANGLDATPFEEILAAQQRSNRSFNRLIQGFLALGLLVGIAALGVITSRAVVERRQQIGMLRAIGYRQSMVQLSFLFEASFVALVGIVIGTLLGLNLSWRFINDFSLQFPGIVWSPPWLEIVLTGGLAYLFSLLTTFLPARKAARIYPAEALRYE